MSVPYHNKALPEGALLREWRLERVLGVGGFGIVYRGRGLYFDELVAIKEYFPSAISDRLDDTTVAPTDSTSEEIYALGLQKFLEEAKVLWNLSKPDRHPNIVSVRSLFEINGTAYMVMDFETGVSLSKMLKDGRRFDEATLLAIIRPIAEGLDRAHRAGVLHRDIKPANILVDEDGRSVLIDFGSARFDAGQATSTKVTFYTPPYAAIEQYVKTYPQGPWTDIYALGVTLYECVTGEKPPEVLERLHGGLGETLSSRDWPGFSRTFTQAVDAAMAPRPSDRPQSISQWLRMFEAHTVAADEEATRIAVAAPSAAPTTVEPADERSSPPFRPAAATATATVESPVEASERQPVGPSRSLAPVLAGGAGVIVVVAVGAALWVTQAKKPAPAAQSVISALPAASAPRAPQVPQAVAPPPLASGLSALAKAAVDAARPRKETSLLTAATDKLANLDAEVRAVSGQPDAISKAAPLIEEMSRRAGDAASTESVAISRDAESILKPIARNPLWAEVGAANGGKAPKGPAVVAADAVRKARADLKSDVAELNQTNEAAAKVAAAQSELAAFKALSAAFAAAKPAFTDAERQKYQSLDAGARQTFAEIMHEASGPKPWIFAPRADKDHYKEAQDNAAKARARIGELDALAQRLKATADLDALNAAALQVTSIQADLDRLKAALTTPKKSGPGGLTPPTAP